jgi:diguanylate cyclase (GGDEF)-like protein
VAGGAVLWRAARALSERDAGSGAVPEREPDAVAVVDTPPAPTSRANAADEADGLMDAFSRMLRSVEQQASAIEDYAQRLDNAYKEIESSSARLKEFSFKDEVTGLYNRRFFSIRLEEEVSRYRRFNHPASVVLLDLDEFKQINDELGHGAGDETLRGMAEILLKHSRGINVICRYGGDEFAVLLVETSKGGARLYADRIRYVLPTHPFAHGRRVTASFGIASLPEDVSPSPDALIRAADEALYAAKRAGKNRVCVYEDIRPATPGSEPPSGGSQAG